MAATTGEVTTRVCLTAVYTVLGYALKRAGVIPYDDGKVMMQFVVNVTLPALLFYTLTHSGPLFGPGIPLVFGSCLLASVLVTGAAFLVYRRRPSYDRGLLIGCMTGVNLGTFAYPFVEAVWGANGLRLAALYDIPNALVVFAVAAGIFAAEQRAALKEARAKSGKHDDGGVYEGEWSVGGDSKQGVGVYTYPSGATYEGQWNNNVKEGYGVYMWPKGGSYAGEFKRGTFNGLGIRFLRSGAVKSGRFEEGQFVEALGMEASEEAAAAATDASNAARKAAEATRVSETTQQAVARILAKIITFPPMMAIMLATVATAGGAATVSTAPLPPALTSVLQPLAAANRPLVLITLGVLFEPFLPRLQMRAVSHFLATKYTAALLAAAIVTAFIPPALGIIRYALAAIVLMPVPAVSVQYALQHDMDGKLAGALANYSQVTSLVALCTLGALSTGRGAAAAARWVLPTGLVSAAALVAALGFVADKALAPKKMVFKRPAPADGSEGGRRSKPMKVEISKPVDSDDSSGGKGPTVAGAAAGVGSGRRCQRIGLAGRSAGMGNGAVGINVRPQRLTLRAAPAGMAVKRIVIPSVIGRVPCTTTRAALAFVAPRPSVLLARV